jgi:hypothetical protein
MKRFQFEILFSNGKKYRSSFKTVGSAKKDIPFWKQRAENWGLHITVTITDKVTGETVYKE